MADATAPESAPPHHCAPAADPPRSRTNVPPPAPTPSTAPPPHQLQVRKYADSSPFAFWMSACVVRDRISPAEHQEYSTSATPEGHYRAPRFPTCAMNGLLALSE